MLGSRYLAFLLMGFWLVACGGGSPTTTPSLDGQISMGGEALGGNASTTLLGQQVLEKELSGDLAWVAHEVRLAPGESIDHAHEFAFVYAKEGTHLLKEGSDSKRLEPTRGAPVESNKVHRHQAPAGRSVFWEVRLTMPGSGPPSDVTEAQLIFESEVLKGIPNSSLATFVHVSVPSGGQTSVHTHPGPEFIYQLSGRIEYQNGIIGSIEMGPAATEGIPAGVAVQKRNPFGEQAEFLSWFLVDLIKPFASPARFEPSTVKGENIIPRGTGSRIAGVSSNHGGGANDSVFGADNAIDGDPATAWSSDGDGDAAWIEIELPTETHVTSLGFWIRTMGTSAEIFSFRVTTDRGEV